MDVGLAVGVAVGLGGGVGVGRDVDEGLGPGPDATVGNSDGREIEREVGVAQPANKPAPAVRMMRINARLDKA